MSDMSSYLGDEVAKAINNTNNGADHQLRNIALRGLSIEQQKAINNLQQDNISLRARNQKLEEEIKTLKRKLNNANNLLEQPLEVIAENNQVFKERYNSVEELMAAWMVSQKGFKELALRFGFDKGLSQEEIVQKAEETKLDVLDNKHDESHGTNAEDIPLIEEKSEYVRERVFTRLNIQPSKK